MKLRKDVYKVTFEITGTVSIEVSADSAQEAENIAWDKYESLGLKNQPTQAQFLQDADIDCVIDDLRLAPEPF